MVEFEVVPERTPLVKIDMQNCFVQGFSICGAGWAGGAGAD
jgi:hypothetical protein